MPHSCFASLFTSLNGYRESDLEFDLALIKERMERLDPADAEAIRRALLPHTLRQIQYAGFCVIDASTSDPDEVSILGTRANEKQFDVDLLCVAELPGVVASTFDKLQMGGR